MLSEQHLLIVLDLVHNGVLNFCPQGKNFTFPKEKFHPYDVRISPKATLWISLHTQYAQRPLSLAMLDSCLPAGRSRFGSNSPLDCYSLPHRRFATHSGSHANM